MRSVGSDHRDADTGPPVQIQRAGLGGRHTETSLQIGDQGPHHRPLLLQRADVAEQDVELNPADPHKMGCASNADYALKMDSTVLAEARDSFQPPWSTNVMLWVVGGIPGPDAVTVAVAAPVA